MHPYFSQACENNKQPILKLLQQYFADSERILEIGSGTGQHAVYFAEQLPHLLWQTSDRHENHDAINYWLAHAARENILKPIVLDVENSWPEQQYSGVFSANTFHIMSESQVKQCLTGIGNILQPGKPFLVYGPFNENGQFTSDSNAHFDASLRARNPLQGIRNRQDIITWAAQKNLDFTDYHELPANNRILCFKRKDNT